MLGTAVAQDNTFSLVYSNPSSDAPVSRVDYIQLQFSKDVTVVLPEETIIIKHNESSDEYAIVAGNGYGPNAIFNLQKVAGTSKAAAKADGKDDKEEEAVSFISTPGTYTYTMPAGVITSADGEVFPEQTFTFTVAEPFEIASITPNGATSILDKIEITFTKEVGEVKFPSSGLAIVDYYWTPVAKIKNEAVISDDRKTVTLELETPITVPGTYNLDIYNGVFISVDGVQNDYQSIMFTIVDSTPSFSITPEDGDKVEEIKNIEITFNNVNEVKLVEGAGKVIAYMPGGGEAEGTASLADKKITVTFNQELTAEGLYMIYIPAGMFTMDGVENEERLLEVTLFKFEITPLEIVSVTPVEGNVEQLDRIIIEFNQKVTLSFDENWQMISREIVLKGENEEYTLTYNSMSNAGNTLEYLVNAEWVNNEYVYTPITEAGTYTINLADIVVDYAAEDGIDEWGYSATIWHGKNKTIEGTVTWTVVKDETGIESVGAENAVKVIYDLTGRRIENITNAGIYIVNGKKVIVK